MAATRESYAYFCSSGRSASKASRDSGLPKASRFVIRRPFTRLVTADSTFLPLKVLGRSGTAKMAEYLNAENAIVAQVGTDNQKSVSFSPADNKGTAITNGSWAPKAVSVYVFVDDKIGKKPVVSYKVKVS